MRFKTGPKAETKKEIALTLGGNNTDRVFVLDERRCKASILEYETSILTKLQTFP
jgi:hypothetical protein